MSNINQPKVFVAGHNGMVGSAIIRELKIQGFTKIVTRTHDLLDLTDQKAVRDFFRLEKPDQVYMAAAKVGGIYANNTYPAEFIYDNLLVQANVINEAYEVGVKKILFLGSSCIYPKSTKQPICEDALLTGVLESTNEPYAIAKIVGIKLCESYNRQYGVDYRSIMPTNLYGIGDNYHLENSHVIPGLIRRFHEAKIKNLSEIIVWGTGRPKREFLFIDDMAKASVFVMNLDKVFYEQYTKPMLSHINVGFGSDVTIKDLATTISRVVNYRGQIKFDESMPDGTDQKLLDSSCINNLGWRAKVDLEEGLAITYQDFLTNFMNIRK
jgi:GDP-L-fucose synthase